MTANNRRKTFIVDAPTQARMVFSISILPMSVILVAAVAMWILSNRLLDEAQDSNAALPSLGLLTMSQFVFVVATGSVAVLEALRYSHRVVGPAMRITRSLRRIRDGGLDARITLRKGDELTEVADEVNALIDHLRQHGFKAQPDAAGGTAAAAATTGIAATDTAATSTAAPAQPAATATAVATSSEADDHDD
jgi:methyl-accepting chemotaxis protein